jgi:hypothetical protein
VSVALDHLRVRIEAHPAAAGLQPWEIQRIADAFERRGDLSTRATPRRMDLDAYLNGWCDALRQHHYAGWKDT